ncbi:helix-turn-helix domain-containing protein [Lacticaseibacillus parakribbianus]|uniref:helix-turn-helix domain-containing protein n=1 Tax=Lacticaseibacillus parakribbianus TaxID=2970927 RepID=UPI0021CB3D26|nr:XRE family transcriptional regulator [Lacticaseibacillus parakribbianus]
MDIGQRIRDLRIQKNLTQEELGERTDLTKGYISQLEHDQGSPSMETFFDILNVLGQTPAQFFTENREDQLVYTAEDQVEYEDEERGFNLRWLVPESNENEMEPVRISFEPGGTFKTFEPSPAETFVYVTKGRVTLELGDKHYLAKRGETIYFHATQQHRIVNAAKTASEILLVATASYL